MLRYSIASIGLCAAMSACAGGTVSQNAARTATSPTTGTYHAAEQPRSDTQGATAAETTRPGLGTVYGETMRSTVTFHEFVRATAAPQATAVVHYNDEMGVHAHASFRGGAVAPHRYSVHHGLAISLTTPSGAPLSGIRTKDGTLVIGTAGARYNILIENHTGERYEVVASVDGLDVVDGQPANVDKRGYIIAPHSRLVIDGFRQSQHSVAAFRFGTVRDSYANRTTGARNVGVIGVAFFSERYPAAEVLRRDTANPFPGRTYALPPR